MVLKTCWIVANLWLAAAVGQTLSPARTEFEVYDVKLNKSGLTRGDYFTIEGSTFRAHSAKLSDLFQYAFKVRRDVISGTPPWFDSDRLDITAKAAPTTSPEELRMMLQSLLIKECKIVMHSELKRMSAFTLLVGKADIRMQRSTAAGRADCEHLADRGPGVIHLSCRNMTVAELAQGLSDLAPGYFDRPIIDETGLTSAFDFTLEWVGRKRAESGEGPTVFAAIEKLGLRFEQRKVPLAAVVIDHMDKVSGQN